MAKKTVSFKAANEESKAILDMATYEYYLVNRENQEEGPYQIEREASLSEEQVKEQIEALYEGQRWEVSSLELVQD